MTAKCRLTQITRWMLIAAFIAAAGFAAHTCWTGLMSGVGEFDRQQQIEDIRRQNRRMVGEENDVINYPDEPPGGTFQAASPGAISREIRRRDPPAADGSHR